MSAFFQLTLMCTRESADKQVVAVSTDDVLHERALFWLRTHLRTQRDWAERGRYKPGDPILAAGNEGRLLAMEYVGAITLAEGAEWRERLRQASMATALPRMPVPEEVRNRAVLHLEKLAAGVAAEPGDSSPAALSSVLAYERAGVLSADEALAWRERLCAQMGLQPERPPLCSQGDLVGVLPGPPTRYQGIRITSVEFYTDGVVIRWHRAQHWPDGSETPRIWTRVDQETKGADELTPRSLTDDVGTVYVVGRVRWEIGINGGGWLVRFGSSSFTPAVPIAAQSLRVPVPDHGIDIALRHD
jgi:hypothetical protein